MSLGIVEIHHHAVRIDADPSKVEDAYNFYSGVLGLEADKGRPNFPGIPGYWINVGEVGQIHLIGGGKEPSPLAKSPDQDPTAAHVALAVRDIVAARQELERKGVPFWSLKGAAAPDAEQLFVNDPFGNMIELHQHDKCRCAVRNRVG